MTKKIYLLRDFTIGINLIGNNTSFHSCCIIFKNNDGSLGFEFSQSGKDIVTDLVGNNCYIYDYKIHNFIPIDYKLGRIESIRKNERSFGLVLHDPNDQYLNIIEKVNEYNSKIKIYNYKLNKGINDLSFPKDTQFHFVHDSSLNLNLDQLNSPFKFVKFISVWRFSNYGMHCCIIANNEGIINTQISKLGGTIHICKSELDLPYW